ncbi:MAG: exo-alpha-sialidase, partial [Chloroflexia bacterium]|nr:exo-alpha-sialidase [Chloroflexia bacterium]
MGIALVLLGLGAVLLATALDGDPQARVLDGNAPINPGARDALDISAHNSPTVAHNPTNGANLAVANRIDSPNFSCALNVSYDGGGHWSQVPIPIPRGAEPKCYAPDVTYGADGTMYLSFVTLKGRANAPNAVWIVTSNDGGETLSNPVKALGPLSFQVRLMADPVKPGRIYFTWLAASDVGLYRFSRPGNPINVARSDNGGATWERAVRVSSRARGRVLAPSPATGPRGELYVLYLDLGQDTLDYEGAHQGRGGPPYPGPWQLVLARSLNRGQTWQESVVADRITPTERFVAFTPPFPSLAVDRASGRVYAGFQDGRLGDADVSVWSLAQGAETWEGPVRVNDTPTSDRTAQYLPKLAVAPGGRLDVVYFDRRADRANVTNQVSLQSSFDEGETFMPRARLAERGFSSRIGYGSERGMPDLGSRLGLVSTDSRALAVWGDTRSGTRASNKQDLGRAVVAFSDPPRISAVFKWLLMIGGIAVILAGVGVLVVGFLRGGARAP